MRSALLATVGLGSVSDYAVRHMKCPTLICPAPAKLRSLSEGDANAANKKKGGAAAAAAEASSSSRETAAERAVGNSGPQ